MVMISDMDAFASYCQYIGLLVRLMVFKIVDLT